MQFLQKRETGVLPIGFAGYTLVMGSLVLRDSTMFLVYERAANTEEEDVFPLEFKVKLIGLEILNPAEGRVL